MGAELEENRADFAKFLIPGEGDADGAGGGCLDGDVVKPSAFGDGAEVARVEDVEVSWRIEAEPVRTEGAVAVAVGVRRDGDESSAGAEEAAASGEECDGIGYVFDDVVEGDGVEALWCERRGVERADVDRYAGGWGDMRVNFLALYTPAEALHVDEPLSGSATDFEEAAGGEVVEVTGVEALALAVDGGEAEEETVEVAFGGFGRRGVGVVVFVEAREVVGKRLGIEPEKATGGTGTGAGVPGAGNAEKAVGQLGIEHAPGLSAEQAERTWRGSDGSVVHASCYIRHAGRRGESKIVCLTGGNVLLYAITHTRNENTKDSFSVFDETFGALRRRGGR